MTRGVVSFVFLIAVLVLIIPNLQAQVTGGAITGKATQAVGMSITVTAYSASLSIISPQNQTYLTNESLLLNYSVANEEAVWYNLDNSANTTITSPIRFNTSQGSHTLYLYANSSFGNLTARNVSFFVNSSSFVIIDDEFDAEDKMDGENENKKEDRKGDSTDFLDYTYMEIQNLNDIILEIPEYGKIIFNEAINLTDDENSDDNLLNIDDNINISQNEIQINSTGLSNFNKSATLYLYNLTFTNPRILRDGLVCPSTICTKQSYSGGTLIFNVTQFTVYSADETPAEAVPTSSGGGTSIIKIKELSLDKDKIIISIKQGETAKEQIVINNTGNYKLRIILDIQEIQDFLKINETDFYLNEGESKIINLDFFAGEDIYPRVYMGKIILDAEGIEKEILIAVEVQSKKSLFDVKTEIPNKFFKIAPGEEVVASVSLFNIGKTGKVDVEIEYEIKNEEDDTILREQETLAVETQLSFIKTLKTPENLKEGNYIFYVKTTYNGQVASAAAWFLVEKESFIETKQGILIIVIAVLIIFIIIILYITTYQIRKIKKHIKYHYRVNEHTLVKNKLIKKKK